jgi:hypothetical protein
MIKSQKFRVMWPLLREKEEKKGARRVIKEVRNKE